VKKLQAFLVLAGLLTGVALAFVIRNWDPYRSIPMVTIERLNGYEAGWYSRNIPDYQIRISATFAEERRLYDITVRQGQLAEALTASWDEAADDWGALAPAGDEDASYFTVPGLFSTVRASLLNEDAPRAYLRVDYDEDRAIPARIIYGPLLDDGYIMDDTELIIEVLSYEEG
jgi:hypothetical protein